MPTSAELAATQYPVSFRDHDILPVEGESLVPIFRGHRRRGLQSLCWYHQGNRAIRQGKWKLNWDVTAKARELYDMEQDRSETRDLAAEFPERVASMAAAWEQWAKRTETDVMVANESSLIPVRSN